jgi:hypothetical protein
VAVETATIRVTRATHDLLAEQARQRGVSLSALLGEIAREREIEVIWRSEREASEVDAQRQDVREEDRAWQATLADGLG